MMQERLMTVLLAPIVSEKSLNNADKNRQFSFKVVNDANKLEIKNAVELMFNVKVEHVRILNVKAKTKRFGQRIGRRKGWKKAYVALKEGYDIDYTNVAT
jgi:large subunit ribosomal protein L23